MQIVSRSGSLGHVYYLGFIGFPSVIRIAHTTRKTQECVKELKRQYKSPIVILAWEPGGRETERKLHQQFDSCAVGVVSKWFYPDKELVNYIEHLTTIKLGNPKGFNLWRDNLTDEKVDLEEFAGPRSRRRG